MHCSALQCIAVHCSALQCIAVHCSALQCIAVHCSALQCVAVHCSALQCIVTVTRDVWRTHMSHTHHDSLSLLYCVLQCVAVCCGSDTGISGGHSRVTHIMIRCLCSTECCRALQCIAVHCRALPCIAVYCGSDTGCLEDIVCVSHTSRCAVTTLLRVAVCCSVLQSVTALTRGVLKTPMCITPQGAR